LRNVVALFHVLEKELAWRKSNGKVESYETIMSNKPIVAVGAEHPLEDDALMADHFRKYIISVDVYGFFWDFSPDTKAVDGADGLHGVHDEHPHLSPSDTWKSLFKQEADAAEPAYSSAYFTASKSPSHQEILRLLKENPADTITIVAVGPLTNVALAAAEDPETFLKVKEVVVMGGAIAIEGNITPVAEFNCYADAVASARVFALTSPSPKSTMPQIPDNIAALPPYPEKLSRQLKLTLFPLDITTPHLLTKSFFTKRIKPFVDVASPLATWTNHFLSRTFDKIESMEGNGGEPGLSMHDPMCIWYMLTQDDPAWKPVPKLEDIRIETSGQWTRGMHVVDRRIRSKPGEAALAIKENPSGEDGVDVLVLDEVPGDTMGWLSVSKGNRINRMVSSPGEDVFAEYLMKRVFG
jgi:inosine-uridine nucleoside N-ribohydrolase